MGNKYEVVEMGDMRTENVELKNRICREASMGEIREAIIEDASSIAEISRSSLGYQCDSSLVARRLREMDSDKQKVYVAVENNVVIGFVHVELYQLLYQNDLANVLGLAVRKDMQKKGYGKKLMHYVECWAEKMNCDAVRLNSGIQRKEAHDFYKALGFENTKAQKRFVKHIQR